MWSFSSMWPSPRGSWAISRGGSPRRSARRRRAGSLVQRHAAFTKDRRGVRSAVQGDRSRGGRHPQSVPVCRADRRCVPGSGRLPDRLHAAAHCAGCSDRPPRGDRTRPAGPDRPFCGGHGRTGSNSRAGTGRRDDGSWSAVPHGDKGVNHAHTLGEPVGIASRRFSRDQPALKQREGRMREPPNGQARHPDGVRTDANRETRIRSRSFTRA